MIRDILLVVALGAILGLIFANSHTRANLEYRYETPTLVGGSTSIERRPDEEGR